MKHHIPDEIRKNCFDCFKSLNEAERAVVMFGEEEYRKSLDLENDDAPCWVMNSGETHGFVVGILFVFQRWTTSYGN